MEASYIDSAVGISDLFPLLAPVIREVQTSGAKVPETETAAGLGWAFSINLPSTLPAEDTLSVWGLPNVLRILDDIDKGKLQRYTFIECHACFEGCVSGALTVENPYVARARALRLQQSLPKRDLVDAAEMRARHERGEFRTTVPFAVRPPRPLGRDIVTAIARMQERDRIAAGLPGIDCGACGSPTCATFAEDVVIGEATEAQCVVLRQAQLEERLAQLWRRAARPPPGTAAAAGRSGHDRHRTRAPAWTERWSARRTPARARCAAATPRICCRTSWPTRRTAMSWVTMQRHVNTVAVAQLKNLAAIVIVERPAARGGHGRARGRARRA